MQLQGLTKPQQRFVRVLIETGSRTQAQKESGVWAFDALSNPIVALAARDRLVARLLSSAPLALGVLERLMTDESVPAAVRRLAASDILDRAGLIPVPPDLANARENLADMTANALRDLVARLEHELFARSAPVLALEVNAENSAAIESKPLSVLD